jgi:predicted metal-dependent hydrolase
MLLFRTKTPSRIKEKRLLEIGQNSIPYTFIVSRLARNIHLKVGMKNGLEIVVPVRHNTTHLEKFIREKQNWILKNVGKISDIKNKHPQFADGSNITILGKRKTIRIFTHLKKRHRVLETENEIEIYCTGTILSAKKTLSDYLKNKAKEYITAQTMEISEVMGTRFNRITIRSQASRWGSCSTKKNLNFNWRLIMSDKDILDYIIIHELAHTVHHNHSKLFHSLVERYCPEAAPLRRKLKQAYFCI